MKELHYGKCRIQCSAPLNVALKPTIQRHRSLLPLTLFFLIPCHGNTLCSNHGDADEDGEDVDCHGNTGWVVRRVWDERDRDGERTGVHCGVRKDSGHVVIYFLFPAEENLGILESYGS